MPAAKRKRRGPAPGTGGRPRLVEGSRAESLTWRVTSIDRERIDRLRAAWGCGDTDAIRRALELADAATRG